MPTIGVMICTAQRPRMVERCIKSILSQEIPDNWGVEICVIENDLEPNTKATIEQLKIDAKFPVLYFQEPKRGIPIARNKTLTVGIERRYDWIALIDDDEEANPDWLGELVRVANKYSADVVSGPVKRRYETPPPKWWKTLKPAAEHEGTELTEAPTNNTLFSRKLIAAEQGNLRFHEALTFGFEDIDFFTRANALGFKIVWAPNAVVEEEIPASRVQPNRLIQRVMTSSAAHAYATKLRKGLGVATSRFAAKGLRRIVSGALICLITMVPAFLGAEGAVNSYYKGRVRLARGLGNLRGLFHILPNYYNTVDGN